MSDKKTLTIGGEGIGLGGTLFIVFLVLKLCHVIDWSWWWVTAPLWAPLAFLLAFLLLAGLAAVIVSFLK